MATQEYRRQRVPTVLERLWLVPVSRSSEVSAFALQEGETEIGSAPACEICLPVPGVEPRHCSIRVDNGRAVVTAHSRMTWVEDGPVRTSVLKPGQRLAVGPVEFRVESRTETSAPSPLDHVDLLRRILAEELGAPQASAPSSPTMAAPPHDAARAEAATSTTQQRSVGTDAATASSADSLELERRRRLIEDLKASVHDQTLTALQLFKDQTASQREARAELDMMRQLLATDQAAVREERAAFAQRLQELEQRTAQLTDAERRLSARQTELQQSTELLEEQHREQHQRETLLQSRIEEINQAEEALAVREAKLLKSQQALETEQAALLARTEESSKTTAARLNESRQQQEVLERSLQSLRDVIAQKDEELALLQSQGQDRQCERAEREAYLNNRAAELDRLAAALKVQEEAIPHRTEKLDVREQALSEQEHRLEQERESVAVQRTQLESDRLVLEQQQHAWASRQDEILDSERRLVEKSTELERRELELSTREEFLRDQERQLDARSHTDREMRSQEQTEAREELDGLRRSLVDARAQLERETIALHTEQESLAAAQREVREAQARLQELNTELEEVRQKLIQDQERLDGEREELLREREAFAAERAETVAARESSESAEPSLVSPICNRSIAVDAGQSDRFELCDAPLEAAAEDLDDEVLEDASYSPAVETTGDAEEDSVLRSRLAALFGMSTAELNARARSHSADTFAPTSRNQPLTATVAPEAPPSVSEGEEEVKPIADLADPSAEAEGPDDAADESASHDPIAAYMEKLLARSRHASPDVRETPAVPAAQQSRSNALAADGPERKERDSDSNASESPSAADSSVRMQRKRPDASLERANIDAFRDLANLSARTAVAKYNSSSLRNRFIAMLIITIMLLVTWIVLMSAPLWAGTSYLSWGLVTAAGLCVSVLELLKALSRHQSIGALQDNNADEDARDPVFKIVRLLAGVSERLSMKRRPNRGHHESSADTEVCDD